MGKFTSYMTKLYNRAGSFLAIDNSTEEGKYPSDKEESKVVGWVNNLYEDAKQYREQAFKASSTQRFGYADPIVWGKKLGMIESGDHWRAYGSRKFDADGNEEKWKSEQVDDETTDQMRTRNAHVTAEWHDIQVIPSIEGISDIIDDNRKQTKWSEKVRKYVKHAQHYGFSWMMSYLDKSTDRRGVANERVLPYGSVFLSPESMSKEKNMGCWHLVFVEMVTGQWIRENFPKFDIDRVSEQLDVQKDITVRNTVGNKTYNYTKLYPKYEMFLDDPSSESTPFDQNVFSQKLAMLLSGGDVPVDDHEDNHKEYVKAYRNHAESLVSFAEDQLLKTDDPYAWTEQDDELLDANLEMLYAQIDRHILSAEQSGFSMGRRAKYPHGRHIIKIDDRIAFDQPNEYEVDWRNLFHELKNEDVPDRLDGRSDIEIMWNTQKVLDETKSQITDLGILGIPRKARSIADKDNPSITDSNDPRAVDYYTQVPPTYTKAPMPTEQLELYRMEKENARSGKLGVTDISRGNTPTKNASGDFAEILASQNDIVIQGELMKNLDERIQDIMETKLMIMKVFYTEPRIIVIDNQEVTVTVSKLLSSQIVQEEGQEVEKEINRFEVSVVPGSNLPKKWERDVAMFSNFAKSAPSPEDQMMFWQATKDKLAQRYPQFGANGKYGKMLKPLQIGLQVMEQKEQEVQAQQAAAAQQQGDIDSVIRGVKKRALREQINGDGN